MVVETLTGETHALVILGRDCRVRATFSAEPFESAALSDTGTVVVLVPREGFRELLEISLDGMILSRRRLIGDAWTVLTRIRDVDYVLTRTRTTRLDRVHHGVPQVQLVVDGRASFTLAPGGDVLAWVEFLGPDRTAGRLRLSTLAELPARGGTILGDNARMAGWSPDGSRLAVLVDDPAAANARPPRPTADSASPQIIVIDRTGNVLRRLPLDHLARAAAPVWLNDHRIAAQIDDRTTYRWFDLDTEEQGDVVDRLYGSTYWMTRSPQNGTLAMWRMGPAGNIDAHTRRLYLKPIGKRELPVQVDDAVRHFLVPSWTPNGELLVRSLETGVVSRVAPGTGALTRIAQLPWTPQDEVYDDHLMTLPDGDLLAVEIELTLRVAAVRSDDEPSPPRGRPSFGGPL
jgi:dipeptidyl aminopeptidase/acylaminoacyl peptidase